MKSSILDSDHVDKETARISALTYIDNILQYIDPLNDLRPMPRIQQAVISFKELRARIEKSSPPLHTQQEVKQYLVPIQNVIVRFLPPITKQLDAFWRAQNLIIQESNKAKNSYYPAEILNEYFDIITNTNQRFEKVLSKFVENPNDEINIDALFYMHILRTETLAKRLREQLTALLTKYKIQGFDAAQIYSIEPPIKQQWRGKTRFLTDAEALRNALAHNKDEITIDGQIWKIHLDNNNEYGYHYKKDFTQKTFADYITRLEMLYKGTMVLMNLLTLWGIITTLLLEKR